MSDTCVWPFVRCRACMRACELARAPRPPPPSRPPDPRSPGRASLARRAAGPPLLPRPRRQDDAVEATGVDAAISALSTLSTAEPAVDKHPEK
jgi:hypothetical protein